MSFDNPRFLLILLFLVVYIPLVIFRYRKDREKAALFAAASPSGERESLLLEFRFRIIMADVFFILFAALLVVALSGPRWGQRIIPDYRRGVDLILAFDLSRSMNVRDCPSGTRDDTVSRLESGIGIARDLAAVLTDVRMGIVIGKGKGVLAVPLSYDRETVLSFLYSLDSMALSGRGTNLESIVNAAAASFQDSIPSRRGIILFSDGEAFSGSLQTAADKVRKAGIALSAVGLGSQQGGPVPAELGPDAPNGFLVSADGMLVTSAMQADLLKNGAEKSGGIYVNGSRSDAAPLLAEYVNSLSAESRLSGYRREANPRWRIFVLAAIACLGMTRAMGFSRRDPVSRRKPSRSGGSNTLRKSTGLLLCLLLFASCERTQSRLMIMEGNFFNSRGFLTEAITSYLKALDYDEAVPYAEYGLGSAYFALEEGTAALERYRAAEESLMKSGGDKIELRYRIYYNMGIIHFEKGEYEEAIRYFRDALKVDGSRIEAKRNLELSLLTLNRGPQPASSSGKTEEGREGGDGSSSLVFEYLRQKEQEQWKSREWESEDEYSGPDY